MKNDEEESNNDEIATRDMKVNFVTIEKEKIANSSEKVDLETDKTVSIEKEAVNGNTESCPEDDSNDVSAEILIFSKTLVDCLNLQKVKGKKKDEMVRDIDRVTRFCYFDLKRKGKMAVKNKWRGRFIYFYTEEFKFRINWWTSTGTFNVQGETKVCNEIILKITQLLEVKTEQEDNIESSRSRSFEVEEVQEENEINEKVKERKPRRGRPPQKRP